MYDNATCKHLFAMCQFAKQLKISLLVRINTHFIIISLLINKLVLGDNRKDTEPVLNSQGRNLGC